MVEEDVSIGKREVERGHVRIYSQVTEQPVEESVRLREEKVTVRTPTGRSSGDRGRLAPPRGRRSLS